MKCLLFDAMMFGIKLARYPAFITYLCHTHLITTFKILYIEYWPIYRIFPNICIDIGDKNPISVGPYRQGSLWSMEHDRYHPKQTATTFFCLSHTRLPAKCSLTHLNRFKHNAACNFLFDSFLKSDTFFCLSNRKTTALWI